MDHNLTGKEVCDQIGVNHKNLWRWERGLRELKGENRRRVKSYLNQVLSQHAL
jgi:transcriptional regulator with XRE-family HTH domain